MTDVDLDAGLHIGALVVHQGRGQTSREGSGEGTLAVRKVAAHAVVALRARTAEGGVGLKAEVGGGRASSLRHRGTSTHITPNC